MMEVLLNLLGHLIDITSPVTILLACYIARRVWREPNGFARRALALSYLSLALCAFVLWLFHVVGEHWPASLPAVRGFLNVVLLPVPIILAGVAFKVRRFDCFK